MYLKNENVVPDVVSLLGGQANGRGKRFYDRNLSLPTSCVVASLRGGIDCVYVRYV